MTQPAKQREAKMIAPQAKFKKIYLIKSFWSPYKLLWLSIPVFV